MKTLLALCMIVITPLMIAHAQDQAASRLYEFTMQDIDGQDVSLGTHAGKVVLLVNTASKCGYTPQYASLEELSRRYADRGLRVLAFPANNFGAQEPGSNEQIKEFCATTYDVTFPLFAKISVKGDDIHPLYAWLTTESPFPGDIRWNFTKFLIDRNGAVVARFETKTDPLDETVLQRIEELLSE
ncbi:MAG: glutathione peroxidase [Bacteroidota bacterium]|nr:glutathione peroxidase [Bacteroidota bacterium]